MALNFYRIVCSFGNWGFTPDGGVYMTYTNRTGATSVKGTIVIASTNFDNAVDICPADSDVPIGVVYEDGIANGSPVKVVIGSRAQVLLEDTVSSTRGYWCGMSSTPGRMYQRATVPAALNHWKEIGHSLETVAGGTNQLAWVNLHFN